jgi:hypothetical protein
MFPSTTYALDSIFRRRGIDIPLEDVNTLRRAEKTLRNWFEEECGNGDDYKSWSIERDPETDIPYRVIHPHSGKSYSTKIPDREKGARSRVGDVCQRNGLSFYVQTDPRGGALYVAREPLNDQNYSSRGVGMYV